MDEKTLETLAEQHGELIVVQTASHTFAFKKPGYSHIKRFLDIRRGSVMDAAYTLLADLAVFPENAAEIFSRKPGLVVALVDPILQEAGFEEVLEVKNFQSTTNSKP